MMLTLIHFSPEADNRVSSNLKKKAEQKYPVEYNMAKDRYPSDY